MTTRKFYRNVITVEVLSEEPLPSEMDLEAVHHAITSGDCSGRVMWAEEEEIDGTTAAHLLQGHGSDTEFFGLDANGENVNE